MKAVDKGAFDLAESHQGKRIRLIVPGGDYDKGHPAAIDEVEGLVGRRCAHDAHDRLDAFLILPIEVPETADLPIFFQGGREVTGCRGRGSIGRTVGDEPQGRGSFDKGPPPPGSTSGLLPRVDAWPRLDDPGQGRPADRPSQPARRPGSGLSDIEIRGHDSNKELFFSFSSECKYVI